MEITSQVVERLMQQPLEFSIEGSPRPHTRNLVLSPAGFITGYKHPNETSWRYHNGYLDFYGMDGKITTRFDCISNLVENRVTLSGRHLVGEIDLRHTLTGDLLEPIIRDLRNEIYSGGDPFKAANLKYVDKGYPHSNLAKVPQFVDAIMTIMRPSFWLEIGSMLGGSLIAAATSARRLSVNVAFVAIDPFCGDVNMWAWEKGLNARGAWSFLGLEDGVPTIHKRFLANVVESGLHRNVIPIPATSIVGMRLLLRLKSEGRIGSLPEVIYLDSAHEFDETFIELKTAWRLLPSGGIIVGDDWSWEAIEAEVTNFARTVSQNEALLRRIATSLPGCFFQNGILCYRGQWIIAKK